MTQLPAIPTSAAAYMAIPQPPPGTPVVQLWVPGTPAPQGSKSVNPRTGRMFEQNPATLPWRSTVTDYASFFRRSHRKLQLPLKGPVLARFLFFFARPKSVSPAKRLFPDVKPDLDKLIRAVMDSLKGTLLTDDAQVVRYYDPGKYYGEPGCLIELWRLQ